MDNFRWVVLYDYLWVARAGENVLSLGALYCNNGKYSFKVGDSLERSLIDKATPLEGTTTLDDAQAAAKLLILLSLKE